MNFAFNWPDLAGRIFTTLKQGFGAWLFVVKLMVPALILTRLALYFELIGPLSRVFEPLMSLTGLPPEAALIWVSVMVANIYVGLSVYLALLPLLDPALTMAQATNLAGMCLLAHTLLVEGQICRAAGLSFARVTIFRILAAFLWGVLVNQGASFLGWGLEPAQAREFLTGAPVLNGAPVSPPWTLWLWLTVKQLFLVLLVIETLMLMMEAIKYLRLTRLLMKLLGPPLRLAGVGEAALMVTIIGCVVGLAYGGGLIVAESRSGRLKFQDIHGSVMLMCFFHSIVEDTFLWWTVGASVPCLLIVRLALALTALATRLARRPFWRGLLVGPARLRPEA